MLRRQFNDQIRNSGNLLGFDLRRGNLRQAELKAELSQTQRELKDDIELQEMFLDLYENQEVERDALASVLLSAYNSRQRYQVRVNNTFINLNARSPEKVLALFNSLTGNIEYKQAIGSDPLTQIARLVDDSPPTLIRLPNPVVPDKDGAQFDFWNQTCIDLTDLQIYSKTDTQSKLHCLSFALQKCGVSQAKLKAVSISLHGALQKKKKHMLTVAQIIGQNIVLHTLRSNGREQDVSYGEYKTEVHIALHSNHYFIYKPSTISPFASKNYAKVIEFKRAPFSITKIAGKYAKYEQFNPVSTLKLVDNLMKQDLFTPAPKLSKIEKQEQTDYFSNIANEQRVYNPEIKQPDKSKIFFCDIESDVTTGNHKMLLIGVVDEFEEKASIGTTTDFMLEYIYERTQPKETVVAYFHNLKYDWAIFGKDVKVLKSCERSNTMYTVTIIYKKRKIIFRDSYKLISVPLSKFSKMFKLSVGKAEAISYTAYTVGMDDFMSIEEYAQGLKQKDLPIFYEALENPEFESDGKIFNAMAYYRYYLNLDCVVLRAGMVEMNKAVIELTEGKLSAFTINTAASLAHKYATLQGCYEDVCEVKGNLRAYIAKAIYGGRVNTNKKYVKKVIEGPIADFDGVSLYPSAMSRLAKESGIAKGFAQHFTAQVPTDSNYYIATVKILAINKQQGNPFIAIKGDGSIDYVNEIEEPVTVVIDKYALQDYIEFHQIEYEIIEGVYWNDGFNKKIGEIINNLFQARLVYKKQKRESLQLTVKLIMNSTYGKTLTKACDEEILYKPTAQAPNFIYKNFNTISTYTRTANWCRIQMSKPDTSYNLGHVGVAILSMSKRIMNEVQSTASDNNIPIYYQDTDSMHMRSADVEPLEQLYQVKYNRELTGKNLGQFHVDFSLGNCRDIHATRSIFLGKKCYIDELLGDGKQTGTHIRMKGISNDSIVYRAKQLGVTEFQLFERLASGEAIEFDLNFDAHHVSFEFANGNVSTKLTSSFKRTIQF